MKIVTVDRLKELFSYNPETGLFTRIVRTSNNSKIGDIVGTKNTTGYLQISIDWRLYSVARLAWLYMTGKWPEEEIDHINGIRNDNRFSNLREADRTLNNQNRRNAGEINKLGFLGVSLHKRDQKITAQIKINGKTKWLGYYKTPELAHAAYLSAKRQYHEGCTI